MIFTEKMAKFWSYQRTKHFMNVQRLFSSVSQLSKSLFGNNNITSNSLQKVADKAKVPGGTFRNNCRDTIGPPDPSSNLRPVIFAKNKKETKAEQEYREARETAQTWNQHFWTKHNNNFTTERKEFQESLKKRSGKDSVTADEMSVFYKHFLDRNWKSHLDYNISWYKQNVRILILEMRVRLSKMKFR